MESNDVRISKEELEALEKVADRARLVLEPYLYYGEAYATPQSLELLRRAVEELEGRLGE